ncbi:MAG: CDP-archaeol synthase, partial [Candidatus Bathyarchaeota archaeon]|nr:CDP-archaeol synthase [Candidatus Bathyarchaeota archaeon]
RQLEGYPVLGDHKTWRGIIAGITMGMSVTYIQRWLYQCSFFEENSLIAYDKINIFIFGFLLSLGTVFGDLFFAFLKRRQNLPPGAPWIPFDQINYVVGAFVLLTPYLTIDIIYWTTILLITFLLHLVINYIGYRLGISRAKL